VDDVVNRLARELAEIIGTVVAEDPRVEAFHERARAEGHKLHISLDAVIGFSSSDPPKKPTRVSASPRQDKRKKRKDLTANDRRFLRSLRIAADSVAKVVE